MATAGLPAGGGGVYTGHMDARTIAIALAALCAAGAGAAPVPEGAFLLPEGISAAGSPFDMSSLNDRIKASRSRLAVDGRGRFSLDGERLRLVGLNRTDLPSKDKAEGVAAWMAAMGLNAIRFHHIDAPWSASLLPGYGKPTRTLDPEALDRLDWFVAKLEEAGILVDMNLLTGRQFSSLDGLPEEVDAIADFKARHSLGFYFRPALDLQKEYARSLLGHRNPYTGKTYAKDPRVAIVEINNENGLVQSWLSGQLEVPPLFTEGLKREWNARLFARFGSRAGMSAALGLGSPEGAAIIRGEAGGSGWNLERHQGASAELKEAKASGKGAPPGKAAVITVEKTGSESWHVQYVRSGVALEAGKSYTLKLRARADPPRKLTADLSLSVSPWSRVALGDELSLDREWREFSLTTSVLAEAAPRARINLSGMGLLKGRVELGGVTLVEGGTALAEGADPARGTMELLPASRRGSLGEAYQREFIRFLYDKEAGYWREMRRFLREDLGVEALLCGTIVGCSFPSLMAEFDVVDSHAYWNHPVFPSRDWDMADYYVSNADLAAAADGGTLAQLAMRRVEGKPFMVTEYDHPYPNRYASQAWPMLASFACFQDWDAIFGFAMEGDVPDKPRIAGCFDQNHNPAKASALPLAAAAFRLGLVSPGKEARIVGLDPEAEAAQVARGYAWTLADAGTAGMKRTEALRHRTAIRLPGTALREAGAAAASAEIVDGDEIYSDTGEIRWRPAAAEWSVLAPGFAAGAFSASVLRREAGSLSAEVSKPDVFLAFMAMRSLAGGKALLWACGPAGNAGEGLRVYGAREEKNAAFGPGEKLTTKADMGAGPPYAIVPSFRAALAGFSWIPANPRAYGLDGRGRRRGAIAYVDAEKAGAASGAGAVSLRGDAAGFWYELAAE